MKKTRIEVRVNIVAHTNACELARLKANDWRDMTINIADSDNEANIDSTKMDLIEFGVYTKTLLADSV